MFSLRRKLRKLADKEEEAVIGQVCEIRKYVN